MKKNILILVLFLALIGFLYFQFGAKNSGTKVADAGLCYAFMEQRGDIFDQYNLKLNIKNGYAVGTLDFLPGNKDKKIGTLEGEVIKPSADIVASRGDLVWSYTAEGVSQKEELKIIFGDGTAAIGVGEMVLGEDGIYKYKSIPEIVYGLVLYETPCSEQ